MIEFNEEEFTKPDSKYTLSSGDVIDFSQVQGSGVFMSQSVIQNKLKQTFPDTLSTNDLLLEATQAFKDYSSNLKAYKKHHQPEQKDPSPIEVNVSDASSQDTDEESQDKMQSNKNLLNDLIKNIDGQIQIPGLSIAELVAGVIKKNPATRAALAPYQTAIDNAETEEDRTKAKQFLDKQVDIIKEELTKQFEPHVNTIKCNFKLIYDGTKALIDTIGTFVAGLAQPKVITVPPGAPNPGAVLAEAKGFKATCSVILNMLNVAAIAVVSSAIVIGFELPSAVLVAIASIATVSKLINTIPG